MRFLFSILGVFFLVGSVSAAVRIEFPYPYQPSHGIQPIPDPDVPMSQPFWEWQAPVPNPMPQVPLIMPAMPIVPVLRTPAEIAQDRIGRLTDRARIRPLSAGQLRTLRRLRAAQEAERLRMQREMELWMTVPQRMP